MPSIPQQASAAGFRSASQASPARVAAAYALAGALLVYAAGFSQMEPLHNGAHDARHAAALPCH